MYTKIASLGNTQQLCQYLSQLTIDSSTHLVIGRLHEGPQRWFGYRHSTRRDATYGWESTYYNIIQQLQDICTVEHFAVGPTYSPETGPMFFVTARTTANKALHVHRNGEPIKVVEGEWAVKGDMRCLKLCYWLDQWEHTKNMFHRKTYMLCGENTTVQNPQHQPFKDVLLHYSPSGIHTFCKSIGKVPTLVHESFAIDTKRVEVLTDMFHSHYPTAEVTLVGATKEVKDMIDKCRERSLIMTTI